MLWKIAWRNLKRQKRRSILTLLSFMGGSLTIIFSFGMSDGMYGDMIDAATLSFTGHGQIHSEGYLDDRSMYNNMDNGEAVMNRMKSLDYVKGVSGRVMGNALASADLHTNGAMIVGVKPKDEESVTAFYNKVKSGEPIGDKPKMEVMVGHILADIMEVGVGDEIALVGQGADGSMANDLFTICGLVKTGMNDIDRSIVYMHLNDAWDFFMLHGKLHEIAWKSPDVNYIKKYNDKLIKDLGSIAGNLEVFSWGQILTELYKSIEADKMSAYVFLFIIVFICALVVLNTVLMSVLERTKELGVLKALGTKPWEIARMVVYETIIISFFSTVLGMALGSLAIWLIIRSGGIPFGESMEFGGVMIDTITARFSERALYYTPVWMILTGILVSILPAIKAAVIIPVKAIYGR